MTKSASQAQGASQAPAEKFGTFLGVYTPSVLTILGLIMYLRFGWVVGNIGLGDRGLVAGIAAGDQSALAEVFERHSRAAYGSAIALLRDPAVDEERLQQAIAGAMDLKPEKHHFDLEDEPDIVRYLGGM